MPEPVTSPTPPPPAATTPPPAAAAVPPPVPPAQESPKPDPLGPRFAALTKETARLAREKEAWAAERETAKKALEQERAAHAAKLAEYEGYQKQRAAFKSDPEAFLKSTLGDDWYDLATQIRMSGGKAPPDLQVQAAREELKAEIERAQKANDERWAKAEAEKKEREAAAQKQAEEEHRQAIATFEAETVDFVKAHGEEYELINLNEVHYLVPQVIREVYEKSKKVLTAKEAADLVEQQLDALEEKKIQTSKKLAAKWQAHTAPKPPPEKPNEQARTLTNEVGESPRPSSNGVTTDDRYARAIAAYDAVQAKFRAN